MSLSVIVEFLKAPPFNKRISQIDLDEQTPLQWIQLLSDILTTLNEEERIDVRVESREQTAFRISDFLTRTLNYKKKMEAFVYALFL